MYKVAITRPISTLMFFAGLLILGIASILSLNVSLFPEMDYPKLSILITTYSDEPQWIEEKITSRAESLLRKVNGVIGVASITRPFFTEIILSFNWGENMDLAYIRVKGKTLELERELKGAIKNVEIRETGPNTRPFMGILFPFNYRDFVEKELTRKINVVPGVGRTELFFKKIESYYLDFSTLNLLNFPISVTKLYEYLKENERIGTISGYIKIKGRIYPVSVKQPIEDIEDLSDLKIWNSPLKDYARLKPGTFSKFCYHNGKEAILLLVYPGGNGFTLKTSRMIKEVLKGSHVKYQILFDKSKFIKNSITSLVIALITGIFLSLGVVFLFFKDPRPALSVGLALPISIIVSFFLFKVFNIKINLITLGGLITSAGMLVDTSIVVLESIGIQRIEGEPPVEASIKGVKEVYFAILASTLTNCAVFLPAVFLKGLSGEILKSFSIVVIGSLLISFVVSITLVPSILTLLKNLNLETPEKLKTFEKFVVKIVSKLFLKEKLTAGLFVALILGMSIFSIFLKFEAFPLAKTGNLKFELIPLKELQNPEEVVNILIHDFKGFDFIVTYNAEKYRHFDIYFRKVSNYDSLYNLMVSKFPGFLIKEEEFDNPEQDFKPQKIKSPGGNFSESKTTFELDPDKIAKVGLTWQEIYNILGPFLGRKPIEVEDKSIRFSVSVRNLEDLLNFPIRKDSIVYTLRDFVVKKQTKSTPLILRQKGREVKEIVAKIITRDEKINLLIALGVAILLVFLTIAAQYNSLLLPLVVMFSVPAALAPVPLFFLLLKEKINPMAIIGLLVLAGVSVNDSIILLDYALGLHSRIKNMDKALLLAIKRRIRPILMTTTTTIFALLPLALGIGPSGKLEMSLAHAIIIGLISSTLSSLSFIPLIFKCFKKE